MISLRGPVAFVPAVLLIAIAFCGCNGAQTSGISPQINTPETPAHEVAAVRSWMQSVAGDVTQNGPGAWLKYFDDSPSFFMANNGVLAFPNSQAAENGTKKFAATISHIEVKWGDDMRVSVLTPEFASVGTSWHEVQVDLKGHRVEEGGYFTATAEKRGSQWVFRDAHWSMPLPPAH